MNIQEVPEGTKVKVTVLHGNVERYLTGTVHSFEQEGEVRYELVDAVDERGTEYEEELRVKHYSAVGFVPEKVLSVELAA